MRYLKIILISMTDLLSMFTTTLYEEDNIEEAITWYSAATNLDRRNQEWEFAYEPCWTWLPHLQLCVCYGKLGMYELACVHNEIAYKYRPLYNKIIENRKYFKKIGVLK